MVPEEGVEPTRPCDQRILSPPRLPFRHSGALIILGYLASRGNLVVVLLSLRGFRHGEPTFPVSNPLFFRELSRARSHGEHAVAALASRREFYSLLTFLTSQRCYRAFQRRNRGSNKIRRQPLAAPMQERTMPQGL